MLSPLQKNVFRLQNNLPQVDDDGEDTVDNLQKILSILRQAPEKTDSQLDG